VDESDNSSGLFYSVYKLNSFNHFRQQRAAGQPTPALNSDEASVSITVLINTPPPQPVSIQPDPVDPSKTALVIQGTNGNDTIVLERNCNAGGIHVRINGVSKGVFNPTGRIIVHGLNGNDDIQLAGAIDLPAELYGDDGDDRVKGGGGDDIILGGLGDDLLQGGGGGSGRDWLIGGWGADRIVGNADDDILVAGFTAYDANPVALRLVMREWLRCDQTYTQRVNALRNGGGLNGTIKLNDTTVSDDLVKDVLTGGAGRDWFLFDNDGLGKDKITDLSASEFANDIDFINLL
jgi:Ca2+-binding RTX toxin-like protein